LDQRQGTLGDTVRNVGESGGLFGNLANMAKGMFGDTTRAVQEGNPSAIGGLGALVGGIFGGGTKAATGALGGGLLAVLGTLAMQAMNKANAQGQGPQALLAGQGQAAGNEEAEQAKARLLLIAMVSAAKADGQIDPEERQRILTKLDAAGTDGEARAFVREQMLAPLDIDAIIGQVTTPQLAAEVYTVSLLSIQVDTDEEREYLVRLAEGMGLPPAVVQQIHASLGVGGSKTET
jgi:uncharacterized membrane protein YebE (DUF533 family)